MPQKKVNKKNKFKKKSNDEKKINKNRELYIYQCGIIKKMVVIKSVYNKNLINSNVFCMMKGLELNNYILDAFDKGILSKNIIFITTELLNETNKNLYEYMNIKELYTKELTDKRDRIVNNIVHLKNNKRILFNIDNRLRTEQMETTLNFIDRMCFILIQLEVA